MPFFIRSGWNYLKDRLRVPLPELGVEDTLDWLGGQIEIMPGGMMISRTYFFDGTWVDEDDAAAVKYATDNDVWHGEPGIEIAGAAGAPSGRREVYLRFEDPVVLPADRPATFVFFFTHWPDAAKAPSDMLMNVGLVTAAFPQAILEAMTWNNKLASAEDHRMYRLFCNPDTIGEATLYGATDGTAPASGADCAGLVLRITPTSEIVVTGVRLWPEQFAGDFAEGTAWIMNTLATSPHRSFVDFE